MVRCTVLVAIFLVAAETAVFAQDAQGTSQEQAACRHDTRKHCRAVKPDEGDGAFLACLQANREKLSAACRNVLKSHGV
jgi:hypothetical protein